MVHYSNNQLIHKLKYWICTEIKLTLNCDIFDTGSWASSYTDFGLHFLLFQTPSHLIDTFPNQNKLLSYLPFEINARCIYLTDLYHQFFQVYIYNGPLSFVLPSRQMFCFYVAAWLLTTPPSIIITAFLSLLSQSQEMPPSSPPLPTTIPLLDCSTIWASRRKERGGPPFGGGRKGKNNQLLVTKHQLIY